MYITWRYFDFLIKRGVITVDLFGLLFICSVDLVSRFRYYTVDRVSRLNTASIFYIDSIYKYVITVPKFQHLCAAQSSITLLIKSQILNGIITLLQKETHNPTDRQIAQRHDNDIKQNRLTGSAFLFFWPKSPRLFTPKLFHCLA